MSAAAEKLALIAADIAVGNLAHPGGIGQVPNLCSGVAVDEKVEVSVVVENEVFEVVIVVVVWYCIVVLPKKKIEIIVNLNLLYKDKLI